MRGEPLDKTDDIIPLRPWEANAPTGQDTSSQRSHPKPPERVAFDRRELQTILGRDPLNAEALRLVDRLARSAAP